MVRMSSSGQERAPSDQREAPSLYCANSLTVAWRSVPLELDTLLLRLVVLPSVETA